MSEGLRLGADGLASKWGFNDGDMPDELWDILDDLVIPTDLVNWHEVLRRLVRMHLVPLLPAGIEVYNVETIHNPIRTDHWGDPSGDPEPPDISVMIPWPDVVAACEAAITRAE
jgi:hypothetical protein